MLSFLTRGVPGSRDARRQYRGSLWAFAALLVVAHLLFGQSLFFGARAFYGVGRGGFRTVGRLPDGAPVMEYLEKLIPASAHVAASGRIRSRLVFRNKTVPPDAPLEAGDVVVLDLDDIFPNDRLRAKLFADPRVHPYTTVNWRGLRFVLYRVAPPGVPRAPLPFLRTVPTDAGTLLAGGDDCIALRRLPDGAVGALVLKTPPRDAEILLRFADGRHLALAFAQGFLPANAAAPGTCFALPVTANGGAIPVAVRPR